MNGMSYRNIQWELGIWSLATISKRVHAPDWISKSSAPLIPKRVYEFEALYQLYGVRKYLWLTIDDCYEYMKNTLDIDFKRSSIWYHLKNWGLTKKETKVFQKFKEYEPWFIHVDISYGPLIDGKKQYIYVAIDRATRLIYIEVHDDKKACTASAFLQKVHQFFPFKITKVLTDNGKEFTLKNHLWKVDLEGIFDKVCKELGIEHRLTLPYHPRTNGMVEKSNDTIKSNTVHKHHYTTVDDMKKDMNRFLIHYNFTRRHSSLIKEHKWRTPFDAVCHYYDIMPELFTESPIDFKEKIHTFFLLI
jgi:transposase-like protein